MNEPSLFYSADSVGVSKESKARSLSFQYMSDLHLEVWQQYDTFDFLVTAPFLILAGDIGRLADYEAYRRFLARQAARYELVFLVLGNHEFYGLDFDAAIAKARQLEDEPRLHPKLRLLHRTRIDLMGGEISILGCTLWSHVPDRDMDAVRGRVKDLQKIENWSVERHNQSQEADLSWLKDEMTAISPGIEKSASSNRVVLVVTHHAPSIQEASRPEQVNNPWTSAFASDLLPAVGWDCVDYWVYGHTHYTTSFTRGSTTVVSNQRGYVPVNGGRCPERKTQDDSHVFDPRRVIALNECGASEAVRCSIT
ncbi:unnamed protein product [Parascedosporium putredinis]|uniref:Calcineurin-like phosphoesterase domain-containing protein n=1 Tax=Parascedosporium putredinis TaxID=1442378 RepID=A0A9P1H051_9PEZI|nr:unnamed protein product [Parascedosporium putredinis]CAI7992450.1 unnamed protein product [Parascedosporium putredinis]